MQNDKNSASLLDERQKICNALRESLSGDLGDIVATHEELIESYYKDVKERGKQSFDTAKNVAKIGFGVLIATLIYTLIFDALYRFSMMKNFITTPANSLTVGGIGVASGLLIEFIAGVQFWLYGKAMRQFNAFHICLERTHRYLIAYKIADKIQHNKDDTFQKLVCIMANAPMIASLENETYEDSFSRADKLKVSTVPIDTQPVS